MIKVKMYSVFSATGLKINWILHPPNKQGKGWGENVHYIQKNTVYKK